MRSPLSRSPFRAATQPFSAFLVNCQTGGKMGLKGGGGRGKMGLSRKVENMEEKKENRLFAGLVMMLAQGGMVQLGKIANPASGKCEVDLAGAQQTVELLEMLKEKTAGNLSEREEKFLKEMLSNMQLNYWETQKDEAAKAQASDKEPAKE